MAADVLFRSHLNRIAAEPRHKPLIHQFGSGSANAPNKNLANAEYTFRAALRAAAGAS